MVKFSRLIFVIFSIIFLSTDMIAQVNAVTFGKNRVQYKKFKWQYYQTQNFNVFFNEGGMEIAKYVAQLAEKELTQIETAAEYSLQRRANLILYNNYTDYRQTNIGLETDILSIGGVTKLVNNKMVLYFDANHANLKRQVRLGIANVLTQNVLFGDDIGEVAGNQTFLDLPSWFIDGYVAYLGENWSADLDDELKSEMLSGNYTKFSKFAFEKPLLAGHAFWYFIEEKYKKENVTYFLYLTRMYKKMNKASLQVTKKKFKDLQAEFMEYEEEKYLKDITRRKSYPKGNMVDGFDISPRLNYYRFNVNPNKKDNSYVVTQYKKGIVRVILNYDYENKTLIKYGTRSLENQIHPSYPMMAWDPKGTRISIIYPDEGRLKLMVYDVIAGSKQYLYDLTEEFSQVQDIKYMLDSKTLLLSAVKNGHTDIFTYNLESRNVKQITNDVYDDLDASFVAFPNKTGIIFSSNRPSANAKTSDTVLPSNNRFNVFLITDFGDKPELNQISRLSDLKYGNARFPMQYNSNHFTFVSDENGVGNRYAGFFTTKKTGLDTLVLINEEILRNPSQNEIDSTLRAYKKQEVDSVAVVSVSEDSAYTFPLTNYQSSIAETRIAGDNNQVSEVTRQSDQKILYKLKIDEAVLSKRNVTAQSTEYGKKLMRESKRTNTNNNNAPAKNIPDTLAKQDDFFQTEFGADTAGNKTVRTPLNTAGSDVLSRAKLFTYKPMKFSADFGSASLNNNLLINKYEVYAGGSGPIRLGSGTPLNGLIRLGTTELMEDLKITGAFRLSTNLKDNEWMMNFQNLKRRIDWGLTYYRNSQSDVALLQFSNGATKVNPIKIFTNLYQGNISYPFDESRSIKFTSGIRSDKIVAQAIDPIGLFINDLDKLYSVSHVEYVYDNSLTMGLNIMNGLRYKFYFDYNRQINKNISSDGPSTFIGGFDARYYYPIYKNFIWAGRAAGDFSFGKQKMIYYLGGVDSWLMFGSNEKLRDGVITDRYFNTNNPPVNDQEYAFQSLAVNMRGFLQNVANGNNAIVINSEFRFPVFETLLDRTINNPFIKNFQITQFFDFGTAWNGGIENIKRPQVNFSDNGSDITVKVKAGGIGPFAGGYGFGVRSKLLGYFVKFDTGWPMNGIFKGKPVTYLSLGLDF